jgi:hypothetical protein
MSRQQRRQSHAAKRTDEHTHKGVLPFNELSDVLEQAHHQLPRLREPLHDGKRGDVRESHSETHNTHESEGKDLGKQAVGVDLQKNAGGVPVIESKSH